MSKSERLKSGYALVGLVCMLHLVLGSCFVCVIHQQTVHSTYSPSRRFITPWDTHRKSELDFSFRLSSSHRFSTITEPPLLLEVLETVDSNEDPNCYGNEGRNEHSVNAAGDSITLEQTATNETISTGNLLIENADDRGSKTRPRGNWFVRSVRRIHDAFQGLLKHPKKRSIGSVQEGLVLQTSNKLSTLMSNTGSSYRKKKTNRRYVVSTITGLISALAEEVEGLRVEVDASAQTPLWNKQVRSIRIDFARLGFKPLRLGGLNDVIQQWSEDERPQSINSLMDNSEVLSISSADEGFKQIDEDDSGALDRDEITKALALATAGRNDEHLQHLAEELVLLYDTNGDGVVDREEYQQMVEDMAELRRLRRTGGTNAVVVNAKGEEYFTEPRRWLGQVLGKQLHSKLGDSKVKSSDEEVDSRVITASTDGEEISYESISAESLETIPKGSGAVILNDLRLDLRRLLFGAIPLVKKITPGGPLVLEPFRATVVGSFRAEDIKQSFLLDEGLKRLAARALRRRVSSIRDFVDGAVFYGRSWNRASAIAPLVEIPRLKNVEFNERDKMIITGVARIQTRLDAPVVENAFKLRTKLGTRKDGQVIRLVEPELALVLECPAAWERNIISVCERFNMPIPQKPEPLYSFFPIYSPFKLEDNDGFDMGDDNCLKRVFVKDGALRFEMSSVLRPGRFLGSHYLAFSFPNRNVIITLDKVKAGIRAARRQKLKLRREKRKNNQKSSAALADGTVGTFERKEKVARERPPMPPRKSFFGRFVEGYFGAEKDDELRNREIARDISNWFGRQSSGNITSQV